jgi:hypothetical protein
VGFDNNAAPMMRYYLRRNGVYLDLAPGPLVTTVAPQAGHPFYLLDTESRGPGLEPAEKALGLADPAVVARLDGGVLYRFGGASEAR